jgi:predicted DNA-binding transcriptional regulator YafY
MSQATICEAIRKRNIITFYYTGDGKPGFRTVEPHMVAYNKAGKLALSAWFLDGASESQTGQWWREYIIGEISSLTVTSQQFTGPRPDFKRDGGKIYFNVVCSL